MSDAEGAEELASVEQLTNFDVPLGSEEPRSSASTPALAALVNDSNGDQPIAVEYAAVATDGTAIPMEGIQQMVVVQQPEEPQTLNGIDVNFLASMVQFCRNAGLKVRLVLVTFHISMIPGNREHARQRSRIYNSRGRT